MFHDPGVVFLVMCLVVGTLVLVTSYRPKIVSPAKNPRRTVPQKVFMSLIAALMGWFSGTLWITVFTLLFTTGSREDLSRYLLIHCLTSGVFVGLVWLFILLPLPFRIPETS